MFELGRTRVFWNWTKEHSEQTEQLDGPGPRLLHGQVNALASQNILKPPDLRFRQAKAESAIFREDGRGLHIYRRMIQPERAA